MAINLNNAVSDKMKEKLNAKDNKPTAEPGFEDGTDFSSLFDDLDSLDNSFGGAGGAGGDSGGLGGFNNSDDPFGMNGGGSGGANGFGGFGGTDSFGNNNGGFGGFGNSSPFGGFNGVGGFGQQQQQQQNNEPKKKDALDTAIDFTSDALKASGGIFKSLITSVKTRNCDDFVSVMLDWMICGGISVGIGIVLKLISGTTSIAGFGSLGTSLLTAGAIGFGSGLVGLGISSLGVLSDGYVDKQISDMADIPIEAGDSVIKEDGLDDLYANLLDEFNDTDADSMFGDDNNDSDSSFGFDTSAFDSFDEEEDSEPNRYASNEDRIKSLMDNAPRVDRKFLVDTFGPFFPENCHGFSETSTVEQGSDEYESIRALILQAISDAAKVDLAELDCDIISVESSKFCYVIVCERYKALSKIDDLKREIESQFRSDAEDVSVSATITIEHGNYKIIITKGTSDIVTIGDCLQLAEVKKFVLDEKNSLPFIAGIDAYGKPIIADVKHYSAIMIAGRPRSGKSWFLISIAMMLMAFNTPEDVEFLLIDPKKSNVFKTMSCLPHVIGLHSGDKMIQIMQELLDVEAERRKEILAKYRCDSIWDLRHRKKVKLPLLLVVIDEFMTLMANLSGKSLDKEFMELFNMAITQLPFVGIYFMFVPHRAQGVVNKTTRANVMFTAAVKATDEVVKETLDIKKWDRPLTKQGDAALGLGDLGLAKYVRVAAATTSDPDNTELLEDLSRAWYKIGFDAPKHDNMPITCNRDEAEIADLLGINSSDVVRRQYSNSELYGDKTEHAYEAGNEASKSELFEDDDFDAVLNGSIGARPSNKKSSFANDIFADEDDEDNEDAKRERELKEAREQEEISDIVDELLSEDSDDSDDNSDGWEDVSADNLWDDD